MIALVALNFLRILSGFYAWGAPRATNCEPILWLDLAAPPGALAGMKRLGAIVVPLRTHL